MGLGTLFLVWYRVFVNTVLRKKSVPLVDFSPKPPDFGAIIEGDQKKNNDFNALKNSNYTMPVSHPGEPRPYDQGSRTTGQSAQDGEAFRLHHKRQRDGLVTQPKQD